MNYLKHVIKYFQHVRTQTLNLPPLGQNELFKWLHASVNVTPESSLGNVKHNSFLSVQKGSSVIINP